MQNTTEIIIKDNQTITDIAISHYGNAEGIFNICMDNNLTIGSTIYKGQIIKINKNKIINNKIIESLKNKIISTKK